MDDHQGLSEAEKQRYEAELEAAKARRRQVENKYNEEKKAFGEKEQQAIELRKIGKTLMTDAKCPLCGHEYDTTQQLIDIIDNAVVVDDKMDALITEIQELSRRIMELEKILDRQKLIDRAKKELLKLADVVPIVGKCGSDYKKLYEYVTSKAEKEKRKEEIVEQQTALDNQGFSIRNINACKEYTSTDSTYLEYKKNGKGTYAEFLQSRLQKIQQELALSESAIVDHQKKIQQNEQREELLRSEIHSLESQLEALDMDINRAIEQALETLRTKFELPATGVLGEWVLKYHAVYDKCELEVERLEAQNSIALERQMLAEYKATIKRVEPMVERCARAVQAFEKMPSLSSFVEKGIRSNIQQISKFFKWMHHSGEFEKLDIDDKGIYAVRGLNNQEVRTYEMSTGQRSTIAMAVMFALHMAAPDAPQFLLLDEPLATMDDTQVLNVLDILKSMAEQNTQIFFTTANGIMINLFKECFKNTTFDYKEYQFVKRVNRPSEIKESSINDTKSIEELTLDDLTLDFHQFAQIRNILRKNQEKLVAREEWEELPEEVETAAGAGVQVQQPIIQTAPENFYMTLDSDERRVLDVLVADQPESVTEFVKLVSPFPNYKTILERINEKALDFYEETIINTDEMLPYVEEDYLDELKEQHDAYYDKNKADLMIEEQRRLAEERSARLADELKKSEAERQRLEEERRLVEESRSEADSKRAELAEVQRQKLEDELKKSESERQRLEAEQRAAEERRVAEEAERAKAAEEQKRVEEERLERFRADAESRRKAEEEERIRLEDELKKSEEERRKLEAEREKEAELRRAEAERRTQLEEELRKAEEKSRQQEEQRKADDARRQEELRKAEEARQLEEQRRAEEEKVLQEAEQQKIRYKQMNVCQYCGGAFTGLFNKKCKVCGKPKDYA